jgi:hypothetical protein
MSQMNFSLVELAAKFYRDKKNANTILMPAISDQAFETLLHVAAGDAEWIKLTKTKVDMKISDLKKAALTLVIQLAFKTRGDAYTVLGLNASASENRIKTHYRLMMRLFHPDRSEVDAAIAKDYASHLNRALENIRALRQIKVNTTTFSTSNTKPPVDVWWDRPTSYPHPDSSFFKRLREGILNYSLVILISLVLIILGVMYAWRETHPLINPEESRFFAESEIKEKEVAAVESDLNAIEPTPHQNEVTISEASNAMPQINSAATQIQLNQEETVKKSQSRKVSPTPLSNRVKATLPVKKDLGATEDMPTQKITEVQSATSAPLTSTMTLVATENLEYAEKLKESPPREVILSQQEMRNLIYDFVDDYNRGQLNALTALMSDSIHTNDNMNKDAWRLYYGKVFTETSKREMSLRNLQFDSTFNGMKAKTHYEIKLYYANNQTPKMLMGTLEIEARFENKQPKMTSFLNHTVGNP